jgi:hypothetical protein
MVPFWSDREIIDLEPATYTTNPEVFIEGFSPGLNYAAFGGSVPTAFSVDNDVTYNNSAASMKFDVPDVNDPKGAYAGGVFFTETGRDLSEYDALTFWARASKAATIDIIGFGNDLGESKFQVSVAGLNVNNSWKKYIIPIPDASKLKLERGMFFYSEGPENDRGYSFWIDELKFEKLGTVAHPEHAILNGENQVITSFSGVSETIDGLISIYNLPDGINMAVNVTPAYFEFASSNNATATVDESGNVLVVGADTAVITATVGGVAASGSLTIKSLGSFAHAPTPTHDPNNVISIYTEAYPNQPVEYYNGYWAPYQTTLSADFTINGDNVLNYTNFNFVGIQFSAPTINASQMTHLHLEIYIPNPIVTGAQFKIQVVDFGADGVFGGTDNSSSTLTFTSPLLVSQNWIIFDIPLSSFIGLNNKAHLAQIIFEGSNLTNFYADNIYLRK